MEDAGASALAVHGRTAAQSYSGSSDWDLINRVAAEVTIPVFGSGDCIEPADLVHKLDTMRGGRVAGVLVGRGALRNPWIFEQAAAIARGERPRAITMEERGQFLLDYVDLLLFERTREAEGFRHVAPTQLSAICPAAGRSEVARGHHKWVINKLRALNSWYTNGLDNGSHLRMKVNAAESIAQLRETIAEFFNVSVYSA
jgi:tRNA-dihydrouridine synthase